MYVEGTTALKTDVDITEKIEIIWGDYVKVRNELCRGLGNDKIDLIDQVIELAIAINDSL